MKTLRAAALLAALFSLLPWSGAAQDRGWTLPGLDGGSLSDRDVASGTTAIVVWAGWSPRCRDIDARVGEVKRAAGGARVVTVNFQEDPQEVREFLAGRSLGAPVFLDRDGAFSKQHHVSTLPGLVVYRDGQVTYQGRLPDDPREALP